MATQVIPFQFEDHAIRVLTIDGEPWFVAKDVAEALDYSRFDSNLLINVPDEWKDTNPIRTPGGIQEMLTLSEPGLYFFVNRSDKPKALPFQKWVAGDVLPSIRKTGSYSVPGARLDLLADSPFPRLHDALNRSLTLLTRPSSRYIQGIALAQTEQLCAQLGIVPPDPVWLSRRPDSPDVTTQVLAAIQQAGPRDIREAQLTSVCWRYRKLSKVEQAELIQRLLEQGEVGWQTPPSHPGARRYAPVLVCRSLYPRSCIRSGRYA